MDKIGFLFDLDGVLIDSEREYSRIWSVINRDYPTGVEALEEKIKGCTLEKILSEYYPDPELSIKVSRLLHELEDEMHYNYLPGAREFLEKLDDKKMKKALVTSSDNKKMKHLREELPELMDYFDFIVTADYVTESKPSPQGYLLAAEKLGKNPINCVVFEDSLQGVKAGRNAGSFVAGIKGTLTAEILEPYSDIVVGGLSEINLENLIEILRSR